MNRTTIMLPADLKLSAMSRAREKGISFGEFVRNALSSVLERREKTERRAGKGKKKRDSIFDEWPVWKGPAPRDGSTQVDDYLAETLEEEIKTRWRP